MVTSKRILGIAVILVLLVASGVPFLVNTSPAVAQTENPYLVRTFTDDEGNEIDEIMIPGSPPEFRMAAVDVPEPNPQKGINILSDIPAFDWCYGCAATSAAMLFGYYDRTGYSNMYAGSTNGGVCPLDNTSWGQTVYPDTCGYGAVTCGECPLSATHQGYDGLATKGHVDDYWLAYGCTGDPYYGNWTEHGYADCTADFMGTNQYQNWQNTDGSTWIYTYNDGSPLYDYTGCEPTRRDGCHGMRLFAESRGYTVVTNYNQYIYGYLGTTLGFTFAQFMAEIDAGRPVLIQLVGHAMLGYGYDTTGNTVYIHDTWDHLNHTMTWGGSYGGMTHYAVTVFQLAPAPSPPSTAPTLSAPANGSNQSGTSVDFSWTAATGATDYYLVAGVGSGMSPRIYSGYVTGLSKTVTGFPDDGTVYYWKVIGHNDAGLGPHSAKWSFTNGVGTPPSTAPTLSAPANGSNQAGTSVDFSWTAATGATDYYLAVGVGSGMSPRIYSGYVTGLSKTVTGFPDDGTVYYWKVIGHNDAGIGPHSAKWSFTNGAGTPPSTAPTLSAPANGSNQSGTSVDFSWTAATGATDYYLAVGVGSGMSPRIYSGYVTGLSKTVTGFPDDGTVYYWKVIGHNAAGVGPHSAKWSFTNGAP